MKFLYFFLFVFSITLSAQQGAIDHSFNPSDNGDYPQILVSRQQQLSTIASNLGIQPDGKILISTFEENSIIRYNIDGTKDSTFVFESFYADGGEGNFFVQPDGKLLVLNEDYSELRRYNINGSEDVSFTPVTFYGLDYISIKFQADSKILVAGSFQSVNNDTNLKYLIRLNTDGTLDASFTVGSSFGDTVRDVAIQADGKIVACGHFTNYNSSQAHFITRLNSDGTLDDSFALSQEPYFSAPATQVAITPSGKILVGGTENVYTYNNQIIKGLVRLHASGEYDITFDAQAALSNMEYGEIFALNVQPDGKIIFFSRMSSSVVNDNYYRLNEDGTIDNTFTSTNNFQGAANRIVQLPDGKLYIGGSYYSAVSGKTRNMVHRVNFDGSLDASFMTGTGTNDQIYRSFVQNDGMILLVGEFTSYNDMYAPGMVRIDINGNYDSSFTLDNNVKLPFSYTQAYPLIKQQADGKILISGQGYTVNGIEKSLIRLNSNGSPDTAFVADLGVLSDFNITSGGKIIVSAVSNGNYVVMRLNENGSLDNTYSITTFDSPPVSINIQPDGKVLLSGNFTTVNGNSVVNLIRLNNDGSPDTSFYYLRPTQGGSMVVNTITQPDMKIIVSYIDVYDYKARIARINNDGTVDTSFYINDGSYAPAAENLYGFKNIILLPDGRLLIGSIGNYFNSEPSANLILLNANGMLDENFNVPMSNRGDFRSLVNCNRIIVTGDFTNIAGVSKNNIAAINIAQNPVSPEGNSIHYFDAGDTVEDLEVIGNDVIWYTEPSDCSGNFSVRYADRNVNNITDVIVPFTLLEDDVTYYAAQSVDGLESLFRFAITARLRSGAGLPDAKSSKLKIYPNPTNGLVMIESKEPVKSISIYNTMGQIIFTGNYNTTNSTLDLSGYNSGMYIIKVQADNSIYTLKVLKK